METILHGRVDSAQPETARSATDRAIDDRFFLVAAALAIVVVGLGFGLEFVPGAPANTRPRTPLIMTHAAVFASWIALFAVQTSLVAAGRVRIHRRLGVAAIGLALGMVILGFATAIRGRGRVIHPSLTSMR